MSSLTVSQKLGVLKQAFREGVVLGAWTRNPADGISVEGASKRKRQSPKKAFTREQVEAMLSMAPSPEWKLFLSVLVWTGARQQEASKLTWKRVLPDRIVLARSKTHDDHAIPMHPRLVQAFADHGPGVLDVVFPHLSRLAEPALARRFRETFLEPMGLVEPHRENTGSEGRVAAPYSLHSFRHTLATWLSEAGVEERERMLLIGHADSRVSRGYTHSQFETLRTALCRA
jgi:integrase